MPSSTSGGSSTRANARSGDTQPRVSRVVTVPARSLRELERLLSSRPAGEPKSDARNNAHLLDALTNVDDRAAHFVSLLVLVRHADDPQPIITEGNWHGEILTAPRGEQGFGYDPLFWVPEASMTAAEMLEVATILLQLGMAFLVIPSCLICSAILFIKLVKLFVENYE